MRLRRIAQRVGLVDLDLDAPCPATSAESSAAPASSEAAVADEVVERRPRHVQASRAA